MEINLPSHMDLLASESLLETLRSHMGPSIELVLNGSDVRRISTPCIQVLAAAALALQKASGRLIVQEPSAEMWEGFRIVGLESILKEASVAK